MELPTASDSWRGSAFTSAFVFPLALTLFFSLVGSAFSEDDEKSVQQIRTLIVQAACHWEVVPLHRLADLKHPQDRMRVGYHIAFDVGFGLLD